MQITGAYTSYDYSNPYGQSGPADGIKSSQSNDGAKQVLDSQTNARQADPDGNPYYQDPLQIQPGLARFGYVTGQEFDTGLGSERASGLNGLNEFISKANGGARSGDAVGDLEQRDNEVRSHEMAHLAAAGSLARGGMQLQYQVGPDGKAYAVGGSVQIDTSEGSTPHETLQKAQQIISAATAPSDPSPQDLRVAAQARAMMAKAQAEIAEEQRAALTSGGAATVQAAYAAGAGVADPGKDLGSQISIAA